MIIPRNRIAAKPLRASELPNTFEIGEKLVFDLAGLIFPFFFPLSLLIPSVDLVGMANIRFGIRKKRILLPCGFLAIFQDWAGRDKTRTSVNIQQE